MISLICDIMTHDSIISIINKHKIIGSNLPDLYNAIKIITLFLHNYVAQ